LQPFRAAGCANDALVSSTIPGAIIDASLLADLRTHVPVTMVRD
jgi:hypothetical protein